MNVDVKKKFFTRVAALMILILVSTVPYPLPYLAAQGAEQYVCLPCGNDCDKIVTNAPGTCSHCQMKLVKKASLTFKTIQPRDLCAYIKNHPQVILIDVRTKEEFNGKSFPDYGTLKNAINIPIQDLNGRMNELNLYKNKEIIVYCSHSRRSPQVSYTLTQNGFKNVTNMAGGLSELDDDSCRR